MLMVGPLEKLSPWIPPEAVAELSLHHQNWRKGTGQVLIQCSPNPPTTNYSSLLKMDVTNTSAQYTKRGYQQGHAYRTFSYALL